jgi:hypothetical protein
MDDRTTPARDLTNSDESQTLSTAHGSPDYPGDSREILLRLLSNEVATEVNRQARSLPGSGQSFGCYYLDAAAQADTILTETGISPENPTLVEQRSADMRTDDILGKHQTMQLYHHLLEETRPSLGEFQTPLGETVRFWPTAPTTKRHINRVHSDRAAFLVVGVCPRHLLDEPLLVCDFQAALSIFPALGQNLKLYEAADPDVQFLESEYAEEPRTRAAEYWETAAVCERRDTLESVVSSDRYEWPELRYPGRVPPSECAASAAVQPD